MKPKWQIEIEKYDLEQAKKDRDWEAKHILVGSLQYDKVDKEDAYWKNVIIIS